MPRRSDDYMQARRDQILDAAVECFIEKGFHATALKDIIEKSGLSNGAIYTHFKSKQDMVRALMRRTQSEREQALTGGSLDELRRFFLKGLAQAAGRQDDRMVQIDLQLLQESFRDEKARRMMSLILRTNERQLERALDSMQKRGELASGARARDAALRLNMLFIGASVLRLVASPEEIEAIRRVVADEFTALEGSATAPVAAARSRARGAKARMK